MTEVVVADNMSQPQHRSRSIFLFLAWRNLWRNKRRTWLAVSAIAFGMLLIQTFMSFQAGSYGPMIDGAARFGGGHMQIQVPEYEEEPRLEHTLTVSDEILAELREVEGVHVVTPRAESYALLSNEERSVGALISGVDPEWEKVSSQLPKAIKEGEYLTQPDHAYIGSGIAKNLDLRLGSELVIFGINKEDGVAATIAIVGGIFESGNAILDRSIVQIPLTTFRNVFGLESEAHRLLFFLENSDYLPAAHRQLLPLVPENLRLIDWTELMPEVAQSIQMDLVGNAVVYVVLTTIIVLSIANSFVMTMFERTREFGMLMSIGIQTGTLFRMVLVEAMFLWVLGALVGYALSGALIGTLATVGIGAPGMEDLTQQFFIGDRIYPAFSTLVLVLAPLAIGFGIFVSAVISFLRLYRLQAVEALRDEE